MEWTKLKGGGSLGVVCRSGLARLSLFFGWPLIDPHAPIAETRGPRPAEALEQIGMSRAEFGRRSKCIHSLGTRREVQHELSSPPFDTCIVSESSLDHHNLSSRTSARLFKVSTISTVRSDLFEALSSDLNKPASPNQLTHPTIQF